MEIPSQREKWFGWSQAWQRIPEEKSVRRAGWVDQDSNTVCIRPRTTECKLVPEDGVETLIRSSSCLDAVGIWGTEEMRDAHHPVEPKRH